jgi:hypothetical protein
MQQGEDEVEPDFTKFSSCSGAIQLSGPERNLLQKVYAPLSALLIQLTKESVK